MPAHFVSLTLFFFLFDFLQTRKVITIEIKLQPGEGKKEYIDVRYKSEYLFVNTKMAKRPIIDGPTFHKIRPDQCNWWLEGDVLNIALEKAIEGIDW